MKPFLKPVFKSLFLFLVVASIGASAQSQPCFIYPDYFAGSKTDVVAGDLNGDTYPDFACAEGTNSVSIFINKGNGSFFPAVLYPATTNPTSLKLADFNGDSKLDIVVSESASTNSITVLLNNGSGGFSTKLQSFVAPGGLGSQVEVVTGDFNSDGKTDVAYRVQSNTTIKVLTGLGTGSFVPSATLTTGGSSGSNSLISDDFNNDGKLDLMISENSTANIYVFIGMGSGTFTGPASYNAGGTSAGRIAVGDLNNDGKKDLFVELTSATNYAVLINNGSGFNAASVIVGPGQSNSGYSTIVDMNNDGNKDVVLPLNFYNDLYVMPGNGNGTFGTGKYFGGVGTPLNTTTADVNKDGFMDIGVIAIGGVSGGLTVMKNFGGALQSPNNFWQGVSAGSYFSAPLDLNGDGKKDFVVTRNGSLASYLNLGPGTFSLATVSGIGSGAECAAVADFNSDGKIDVATANSNVNDISVLMGNGAGGFSPQVSYPTGFFPYRITTGDYNGDGKPDLAYTNAGVISVSMNSGTGSFLAPVDYTPTAGTNWLGTADYNNDSKPDLAVAGGNRVNVFLNNGSGGFLAPVSFTPGTNAVMFDNGDFNNDGLIDFAVANQTSNNVTIHLNQGSGTFTTSGTYALSIIANGIALVILTQTATGILWPLAARVCRPVFASILAMAQEALVLLKHIFQAQPIII